MKKLLVLGFLLVLVSSCGGGGGGGSSSTGVASDSYIQVEVSQFEGNYVKNIDNDQFVTFISFESGYTYTAYYMIIDDDEVYSVRGFYTISNGTIELQPFEDDCNRGIELFNFRFMNRVENSNESEPGSSIYLDDIEYYRTYTPMSQWSFNNATTACWE